MILLDTGTHRIETDGRLLNAEELARAWRDSELSATDWVVSVTDHPEHTQYMSYRQALRDWPATPDFPNVRPVL